MNTVDIDSEVIDTKLVYTRDALVYHIGRIRKGIFDRIDLTYSWGNGVKTVSHRVPYFLGWLTQAVLELAIPLA